MNTFFPVKQARKYRGSLLLTFMMALMSAQSGFSADLLVEAESFSDKGGWVLDQQFMDLMGSPYLMAHGMGKPVKEARTKVTFPEKGDYTIYVRTYNWTAPWKKGKGPGCFALQVGDTLVSDELGVEGDSWTWQKAGTVNVKTLDQTIALKDKTGFNGRCDAVYFTTVATPPPSEGKADLAFRQSWKKKAGVEPQLRQYDFVVTGGGVAGMCAAVSAARLGMKVALIHDRPVLGGNNSSEVRVHLGGRIEIGKYKALGNLLKEFAPTKEGNAMPASYYDDSLKDKIVAAEKNIDLYASCRATGVKKEGDTITSVLAEGIDGKNEWEFSAPLFADCTGDGTIGYWAGADYRVGRESRAEFGEKQAPEKADKLTMGTSIQWYSRKKDQKTSFPPFSYGLEFNDKNAELVTMGEWDWETGMNKDQILEFEQIRDYGLMVVFSNWSYLKNQFQGNAKWSKDEFAHRELDWVAYIGGKRESRRLMGDYILTEKDLTESREYPDGTAATTWSMDLHYPAPDNTKKFPEKEFKSIARHTVIHPYEVPYRCLYSRNVKNLFMAGRNVSVTHCALGTVRVMRTTAMLGEVVGMAASLCKKEKSLPAGIYPAHWDKMTALMQDGVGKKGLPNTQKYNQGATLPKKK